MERTLQADLRMRSNIVIPLLVGAMLQLVGCATGDGETFDLTNSTATGKSDSIDGKRLSVTITDTVHVKPPSSFDAPASYRGTIDVKTIGDAVLEVRGPELRVRAGVDRLIDLKVVSPALDVFTKLMFVARVRAAGSDTWSELKLSGTNSSIFGGSWPITINYFDWVLLDPVGATMKFRIGEKEYSAPFKGAEGIDAEYSLFVFPESGWGSLDGTYNFELQVRAH